MSVQQWLARLGARLSPLYTPPQGQGGHDLPHVLRMVRMYSEISELIPGVKQDEYKATVWLHNIDRCPAFNEEVRSVGLDRVLHSFLETSPFTDEVKEKIIGAILGHGKRWDEPDDSEILQVLRLADKWDRIGVIGITSGFAWLGCMRLAYDVGNPFGYGSTAENGWKTIYQNFYRILEWYADFPLIRELVRRHPWRFEHMLAFIRAFGREVADAHGLSNTVEEDIKKCLGKYYNNWQKGVS